ncbi:sugar phosphate isomerase/epimerase family protein [Streptomyces hydrogenans]|uniref:sugar phosphate isomerase/epimerase family protein n=1 Tax=Streptomyces hydrogenans TaxID=1873719 RepID=UPI00363F392F
MPRPFTLFTGQWADLPLEEVCRLARDFGFDGLELACWGDHFEVDKALADPSYLAGRHALLDKYGLRCWAISNHLVGQAVCDHPIDERHQGILPARIWGDGEPEGVRRRAAAEMRATARAAAAFGVDTVVGFTGSSIWHLGAMFPPVPERMVERGYEDFAERWNPVLDVFDAEGVRFAHEVHPGEIAYDYWTTRRGWDFVSAGHGDVPWEDVFRMLRSIGYQGPVSVEWEDAGMDRLTGAPEALAHLKRFDFDPPAASFDAAFSGGDR